LTVQSRDQDERNRIEQALRIIEQDQSEFIDNLDAALAVIAEVAERYPLHTPERQRDILEQMVSRVVINPEGRIIRIELKAPFDYIDGLHHSGKNGPRDKQPGPQKERTSPTTASSFPITCGTPTRTRTWASASGGQRSIL
jgi:hypothetical protein